MNSKITFPRLASMLAEESGRSKRFSEDFLREFFTLVSERLVSGDAVKIKGLGTFRVSRVEPRKSVDVTTGLPMEIAGHSKVVFIPSKEMADAVNAPFEAFPTVEIDDAADLSSLNIDEVGEFQNESGDADSVFESEDAVNEIILIPVEEEKNLTELSSEDDIAILHEEIGDDDNEPEEVVLSCQESEMPIEQEEDIVEESVDEQAEEEQEPELKPEDDTNTVIDSELEDTSIDDETFESRKRWRRAFFMGMLASLALIVVVGGVVAIVYRDKINVEIKDVLAENTDKTVKIGAISDASKAGESVALETEVSAIREDGLAVKKENQLAMATEDDVPTAPSDALVYDTIGKTRYLTTMAKAHYGNYNLWPVIYEENKAKLGHPDRIRPGTPVVIPKLSKYGVDPFNRKDVEKIKNMGIEIYARYGKKI